MSDEVRREDAFQWTATTTAGTDTVRLTVKGVCSEPTPGYKLTLTRVDVRESDPSTLSLVLTASAPTGIEPQHVASASVEYDQTFLIPKDHVPSQVMILQVMPTLQVEETERL